MNLNISYNWLKEYVRTNLSAEEFAKKISLVGPSVDHVTHVKPNFEKVVVGQIIKIEPHPNADKLRVCKVNIDNEELQIVCGAPNIKEGQKVPVVLVGGKVGEMEIKKTAIRGVESFGMMCSQKELCLGDDHTGIYILPNDAAVGESLQDVMPISDTVLDVEVTSNRPDAMSVIGLAREAAAALDTKFTYKETSEPGSRVKFIPPKALGLGMTLNVKVHEKKLCPRYQAVAMSDVEVKSSPLWMQQRLISAGLRPINNLVDITNYILLEFGQPMHVFDYDKLQPLSNSPLRKGREDTEINVRLARGGEKILALDGQEYELSDGQLVIADAKSPVAVAGIMGGELSAAAAETKKIVFECANFDPVSVRRTSRALNLRSDSSNLYEKGISPENTRPALLRAIELAQEICGAKVASQVIDEKSYQYKDKKIKLNLAKVNEVMGVEVRPAEIKSSLEALGFKIISQSGGNMEVAVPWWRDGDIFGPHDLIEEISRMHGYANLPSNIMAGVLPVNYNSADDEFYWEDKVKDILAGFGLTEIYTYSFISEKAITSAGLKPSDHIRIANPLSADFEYMRISLAPGALQIIAENQGLFSEGKLFDLSKVYIPKGENDLADEKFRLLIAVFGNNQAQAFDDAKGIVEGLKQRLHIDPLSFRPERSEAEKSLNQIQIADAKIRSAFGLKKSVVIAEFDCDVIMAAAKVAPEYKPIPKFPAIELDLSMEIGDNVPFSDVAKTAQNTNVNLIEKVNYLSVYQGDPKASGGARKIPEGKKALAIRIVYRDSEKTLELGEAQEAHDKVVAELKKEYNIIVR